MIYPLVTYPAYIGSLFVPFLNSSLRFSQKKLTIAFLLNCFVFFKLIEIAFSSHVFSISDVSEFKMIFFLTAILLVNKRISRRVALVFYASYVVFGLSCFAYVVMTTGQITRFMDLMPGFTHYISVYFTVTAAGFLAIYPSKIVPYFFVLVSSSGTGMLALMPVILSKLIKSIKNPIFFLLILSAAIVAISLVISVQASRGRSLLDLQTIDRVLFYLAIYEYLPVMSWKDFLIGHHLGQHIPVEGYVPSSFAEYLLAERDGYIPPRMFHSDYLRIFLQYGIIGLLFFMYSLWVAISNRLLLCVLLAAAFANSVFFISSIMIAVFYMNRIETHEAL